MNQNVCNKLNIVLIKLAGFCQTQKVISSIRMDKKNATIDFKHDVQCLFE